MKNENDKILHILFLCHFLISIYFSLSLSLSFVSLSVLVTDPSKSKSYIVPIFICASASQEAAHVAIHVQ